MNNQKPLYSIKNLITSYDGDQVVVKVPQLEIYRGEVCFILGVSGIGKSTLLESLGLMNFPVKEYESLDFYERGGNIVDLKSIWTADDEVIADYRMRNYSFIFQNTNLMPGFTAGQNMIYTLLLEGVEEAEAKKRVIDVMRKVGLPENIYQSKIQELSGGQRQRLAFVRAFVSNFEVLFGDEPTGNLDEYTAKELVSTLKAYIIEENKTAIIVSHDINLAIEFADKIYIIQRDHDETGILKDNEIYESRNGVWYMNDKEISDVKAHLKKKIA